MSLSVHVGGDMDDLGLIRFGHLINSINGTASASTFDTILTRKAIKMLRTLIDKNVPFHTLFEGHPNIHGFVQSIQQTDQHLFINALSHRLIPSVKVNL